MPGMKTQAYCLHNVPKVRNFCVLLNMFHAISKLFIAFPFVHFFQDSIGFHRSDPVDFDRMDLYNWHPRGDSLEFVVFDIILNCGVNLKFLWFVKFLVCGTAIFFWSNFTWKCITNQHHTNAKVRFGRS